MPTRWILPIPLAIAAATAAQPPVSPPLIEKPARPGVTRTLDPANYAHCRWSLEPHDHAAATGDAARGSFSAPFTTLIDNGPSSNRIDLVVVGDGYTVSDLPAYAVHAQSGVDDLFATPPFDRYKPLFNVHRVQVLSDESGVSGDPTADVSRDTALGMRFWCGNTERALCVDTFAAASYAENAPDWDQIFAVANSTKYGGVGYPSSDIGTYSGGNAAAPQIAIHELGHTLGNLADEYTYGGSTEYTGPEPTAKNVSIFNEDQLAASGAKWARWLGVDDPMYDGLVSTFEGGNYAETGIYRPTTNSMMRNLGREFNLPSAEGLIIEMWKTVSPVDSHTSTLVPLERDAVVEVRAAAPFLIVRWYINGELVSAGPTLDLRDQDLSSGLNAIRAEIIDDTDLVRDETAREDYMTVRLNWTVIAAPADLTGDGVVNTADLGVLIGAWGTPGADINSDGTTDVSDLGILLAAWS